MWGSSVGYHAYHDILKIILNLCLMLMASIWGRFDVLATLRRSGEPYQLTPTDLFKSAMLSSGAMTNRLNKLEEAGLIEQLPDPNDQ